MIWTVNNFSPVLQSWLDLKTQTYEHPGWQKHDLRRLVRQNRLKSQSWFWRQIQQSTENLQPSESTFRKYLQMQSNRSASRYKFVRVWLLRNCVGTCVCFSFPDVLLIGFCALCGHSDLCPEKNCCIRAQPTPPKKNKKPNLTIPSPNKWLVLGCVTLSATRKAE